MKIRMHSISGICLLVLAILACNFQGLVSDQATATPVPPPTDTLAPPADIATLEPPVDTPAVLPEIIPIEGADTTATAAAGAVLATQQAQLMLDQQSREATAAAFQPYVSQLPQFGVDPAKGEPGWSQPSFLLETKGYQEFAFDTNYMNIVAEDFVVSADITWNTQYGDSGCGFLMRSDGNEAMLNQYMVVITRVANGRAALVVMANGQVANIRDVYAHGLDPSFNWQNDVTNRLTVVARGQTITIYTNGVKLGDLNPSEPPSAPYIPAPPPPPNSKDPALLKAYEQAMKQYQKIVEELKAAFAQQLLYLQSVNTVFPRGFVAMAAFTNSGYTRCQFDNAWLWLIKE